MVNRANPLNAYRETKIKTASQGKLIVMLYDEAIRQLDIASDNLQKNQQKLDLVNNAILKAQDILTELMVSLDFDRGGEIAKGLFSLYTFFNQQLVQANLKKDIKSLVMIKDLLVELRGAWASIASRAADVQPVQGGVNIAG
jgi:flagellar protein FliS